MIVRELGEVVFDALRWQHEVVPVGWDRSQHFCFVSNQEIDESLHGRGSFGDSREQPVQPWIFQIPVGNDDAMAVSPKALSHIPKGHRLAGL
jgi:hypothetical protein